MHEINLLPPERRRTLRREVSLLSLTSFLSSLCWALGIVTGGGIVVAVAVWVLASTVSALDAKELQEQVVEYQAQRENIVQQNVFIDRIHLISQDRIIWSDFITNFLAAVPAGVEITTIGGTVNFHDDVFERPVFTVSGQALSRSALTVFHDRLQGLPNVAQVEAPSSNLIRRDNPLYRFTLTLQSPRR